VSDPFVIDSGGADAADWLKLHSPVQEHHIDFLLEEEFACSPQFLRFFVSEAAQSILKGQASSVVTNIPTPHETTPCQAIRSVTTGAGESDVLVVYRSNDPTASRVAILIENKIRASFQKDQADRYRERGEAGMGEEWDSYWTCLVAPEKYSLGFAGFDGRVSLEQIGAYFGKTDDARSNFKARIIRQAIERFSSSGVQVVDEVMTEFRRFYAEQAERHFQGSEMDW
jgi:hypothetical protein